MKSDEDWNASPSSASYLNSQKLKSNVFNVLPPIGSSKLQKRTFRLYRNLKKKII
jgi:hypothetical protein